MQLWHQDFQCSLTASTAAAAAAKSLQSCRTLCDPIDGSPPGSPVPGDSSGKNTGVGCHFLLQCMKVKSESVPGSSPGGSREFKVGTALARENLFIWRYKIRLGRNSIVGKLSGEKRLNNLVYVESQ